MVFVREVIGLKLPVRPCSSLASCAVDPVANRASLVLTRLLRQGLNHCCRERRLQSVYSWPGAACDGFLGICAAICKTTL